VPKATTVRLQPELLAGLALLQRILKKPMNRMINEAVRSYVERQSSEVEADLQHVLEHVKAIDARIRATSGCGPSSSTPKRATEKTIRSRAASRAPARSRAKFATF